MVHFKSNKNLCEGKGKYVFFEVSKLHRCYCWLSLCRLDDKKDKRNHVYKENSFRHIIESIYKIVTNIID